MDFLIGSKKEFFDFINSIDAKDRVGILTHSDLDGIASAIFLQLILETRGHKVKFTSFLNYHKGTFSSALKRLKENDISKVFILDMSADHADPNGFRELRKNIDCFLVDHHPFNEDFKEEKNIIKTESSDCSSLAIYELGEDLIDKKKWAWLICAAILADYSFKKKENLEFVQSIYSDVKEENVFESSIGKKTNEIVYSLIYYGKDKRKVYDLLLNEDLEELGKVSNIVNEEIKLYLDKFKEEAKYYPERNLYFYYFNPRFAISSIVATILSSKEQDKSFIVASDRDRSSIKVSARNQSKSEDMNELMKRGTEGLENASGGGHIPAAAALIQKKDLEKFKENILK